MAPRPDLGDDVKIRIVAAVLAAAGVGAVAVGASMIRSDLWWFLLMAPGSIACGIAAVIGRSRG